MQALARPCGGAAHSAAVAAAPARQLQHSSPALPAARPLTTCALGGLAPKMPLPLCPAILQHRRRRVASFAWQEDDEGSDEGSDG